MADFDPVKSLTVSMGLANSSIFQSEDSLLAAADEALYRAKNNGRNRLEIEHQPPEKATPQQTEASTL